METFVLGVFTRRSSIYWSFRGRKAERYFVQTHDCEKGGVHLQFVRFPHDKCFGSQLTSILARILFVSRHAMNQIRSILLDTGFLSDRDEKSAVVFPKTQRQTKRMPFSVRSSCLALIVLAPWMASYARAQNITNSISPALPQVFLDTNYIPTSGTSHPVDAGGDLQAAIDNAVPGDEIVLQAGARFTGNFILRAKAGSGKITIRSSQLTALPEGTRVGPSQVGAMATVVSPNSMAAFTTEPGASSYRLAGLEITIQDSVPMNFGLVVFGDGSATSLSQLPTDMILDRSYLHGNSMCNCQRGVAFNGIREAVIDSYISEIHYQGVDSQAICGWAGAGPFKIVNNYLEAAGENIMFGGAPPAITNLIPSDIEIRRNLLSKQMAWMTSRLWAVKNLFELKNAQRLMVDGNIFENNWIQSQVGFAILFQGIPQSDTDLWSTVQDVTFTNNLVRHSANGINFCGGCWYATSPDPGNSRVARVYFANNVLDDINGSTYDGGTGSSGGGGLAFQVLSNVSDLAIEHNTVLNTGTLMILDGKPSPRVHFVNNIVSHGPWGITGSGLGSGNPAIAIDLPYSTIAGNLIVGLENTLSPSNYPVNNLFPSSMDTVGFTSYNGGNGGNYQLVSSSPYHDAATDGRDPGIDMNALNTALQGNQVQSPTVAPSLPHDTAVSITSPTSSATFTSTTSTIDLNGVASASAGITQVSWTTDHGASGIAAGTSSWTINGFVLPAGTTQVTVTARDASGNQATAVITLTFTPPDSTGAPGTTAPSITINSPTSQPAFNTSQDTIAIGGTASADTVQITWQTDQGGRGLASGTTNWTAEGIKLQSGSNRIQVTAFDSAGYQSSAVITVIYGTLSIKTVSLRDGKPGTPYSTTLTAAGGIPPYTWSSIQTPDGFAVSRNGLLTGTPPSSGTFRFTVAVLDSVQMTATATVSLQIDSGLRALSAASLKDGPVAPGSMVTLLGQGLADSVGIAMAPALPTTLGNSTVIVRDANGVERQAALHYVSPTQINFTMPTGTSVGTATVRVTGANQTQNIGIEIVPVAPALFSVDPNNGWAAGNLTRLKDGATFNEAIVRVDLVTDQLVAVPVDLSSDADQVSLTLYVTGMPLQPSMDSVSVTVAGSAVPVLYAGGSGIYDDLESVSVLLPSQLRGAGVADIVLSVNGITSNTVRILIQ
jgi:uncharacterized protein (TIGR03437 family)